MSSSQHHLTFIDSHAHLEWDSYKTDFDEMLARAYAAKVELILNIGTTLEHSKKGIELASKHKHIFATVGIHPHEVKSVPQNYLAELKKMAEYPKVKAIGEIGLDYFYEHSDRKTQLKCFEEQVALAKELKLPLSIHCRDAFKDAFEVLDRVGYSNGVFHCFTGTWEEAQTAVEKGFYISISGIVTFKKSTILQDVVRHLPIEKMLIETDAPFLAPEPHRGKRNEPAYVRYTAQKIADLKNLSLEEVATITTQNATKVFSL